jgi:hypothetical protein
MESLFTIGQKVVCVDSKGHNTNLIEGKTYTIQGIRANECCGVIVVNVGVNYNYERTKCGGCGGFYSPADGYKRQTRFVPLDTDRELDEAIHEALKESLKIKA